MHAVEIPQLQNSSLQGLPVGASLGAALMQSLEASAAHVGDT